MSKTGNVVPDITRAEHIGPDSTGDNIEAKRVAGYTWNAATGEWERQASVSSTYESYTDTTTDTNLVYLGKATPGSATSDAAWQIKRYNKTTGHMSFADDITTFSKSWDLRTTYVY